MSRTERTARRRTQDSHGKHTLSCRNSRTSVLGVKGRPGRSWPVRCRRDALRASPQSLRQLRWITSAGWSLARADRALPIRHDHGSPLTCRNDRQSLLRGSFVSRCSGA